VKSLSENLSSATKLYEIYTGQSQYLLLWLNNFAKNIVSKTVTRKIRNWRYVFLGNYPENIKNGCDRESSTQK